MKKMQHSTVTVEREAVTVEREAGSWSCILITFVTRFIGLSGAWPRSAVAKRCDGEIIDQGN